jgi:hypothetical protein
MTTMLEELEEAGYSEEDVKRIVDDIFERRKKR